MDMKLELKHLAPYLPYQLGYRLYGNFPIKKGEYNIIEHYAEFSLESINKVIEWDSCKPILRPLSDLTKDIYHNGENFVPSERIKELYLNINGQLLSNFKYVGYINCAHSIKFEEYESGIKSLPYWILEDLFEWHFDVFGLIEKGLAIDKNTQKRKLMIR